MIDVKKIKGRAILQKEAGDFGLAVAAKFDVVDSKIKGVKEDISKVAQDLKDIELTPGPQGEVGEMGPKPIAGIDYPLPENGKDGYTPVKGKDYFDGRSGRDGVDGIGISGIDGRTPMHYGKEEPKNPQKGDLWYQD